MTKMKTLKRCAVAALLLATAIPAQAQDISIAGAIMNTQDPFWTTVGCGAKAKGAELGVKVDIFSSTTMDAKEFSANVNAALLAKPNGFFATPGNPAEFATQFGDLMKNGVPVVTGFGTKLCGRRATPSLTSTNCSNSLPLTADKWLSWVAFKASSHWKTAMSRWLQP
jgi:Periplasmic binding protein domain